MSKPELNHQIIESALCSHLGVLYDMLDAYSKGNNPEAARSMQEEINRVQAQKELIANLKLADLMTERRVVAAFPKLVRAVQLVLVIERQDVGTGSRVVLDKKAKAQLVDALKVAGEEIP